MNSHNHSHGAEYSHARHSDEADDGETLDSFIGTGCHANAGNSHQQILVCLVVAKQLGGNGYGKHGKAHAKPSDLRERNHCAGQIAAVTAKAANGEVVERQSAFAAHKAECSGVSAKDDAAKNQCADKAIKVEPFGEFLTHPHACREEGESHHNHKHAPEAASCAGGHLLVGVIDVNFVVCLIAHN